MPTQKDAIRNLIEVLKQWQQIEDDAVRNTSKIIKKAENPLIKIIMEIIRQDSAMHKRIQQMIIDNFEKGPISLDTKELNLFWELVEEHDKLERKTIEMAEKAMNETTSPLANYLLKYLLVDEQKHNQLLEEIEKVKKGIYPYGKI
ncbi:ferritin-like domain-containing protein [Bacteroidetes/Chlorobi group bacterium ChocPot_Mid]|jgi:rubrerythrin|nr:MAG: ferritin-like domain-containing protein [Bacteroidetes/Chlorobi group bacterium ChocPot_Mid]